LAKYLEPAVVIVPFRSIRSLTAKRKPFSFFGGGQYEINARSLVAVE
jgi:hypothetical protein